MSLEPQVKLAIYRHFAATGSRPTAAQIAERVGYPPADVLAAFRTLRLQRVLVLEADGESIRMAPPFSGVPTQHEVLAGGRSYFANCAWDALGIPAALHEPALVRSRCEQSLERFELRVGSDGAEPSTWLFHCAVPAAHWWDDIVFT